MNTRVVGDIGQAQAVYWFTVNDYIVSVPTTESSNYDLVVNRRGTDSLERIQCKRSSGPVISLRTKGGNKSGGVEVKRISTTDVEFVWCSTNKGAWLIPSSVLEGMATVQPLSKVYHQYKVLGSDESGLSASL